MAYYPSGPVNPNLPTTYNNQPNFQPASQQQEAPKNEIPWGKITIGIVVVVVVSLLTGIIELPSSTVSTISSDKGSGTGSSGSGSGSSGSGSGSSGSAPPVPKVYKLAPMYYSEKHGTGVTPFGGTAGSSHKYSNVCPSGTKVVTDISNKYGPKAGYYAHSLNNKTPANKPYPASCATAMQTGADALSLTSDKLRSFATIDGDVVFNNNKLNDIWGDKCGGYYKTLQLDLHCAENGIPDANATVVSHPTTAGFANRFISRY
jgi:hypothetical protein